MCKYVNKGSDIATFVVEKEGTIRIEVNAFLTGRYISTNEAVWKTLGFDIHERNPAIVKLSVELKNGQRVIFDKSTAHQQAQAPPETTLT